MSITQVDCQKCGGSGKLPMFAHVDQGTCFRCAGSGKASPMQQRDLNDQIVDHIFSFFNDRGDFPVFAQIYVWHEGTGKNRAGTGSWFTARYYADRAPGDQLETITESTGTGELNNLIPLAELREVYALLIRDGYKLLTNEEHDKLLPPYY